MTEQPLDEMIASGSGNEPDIGCVLDALEGAALLANESGIVVRANAAAEGWLSPSRAGREGLRLADWRSSLMERFEESREELAMFPDRQSECSLTLRTTVGPRRVYRLESRPVRRADGSPAGRLELLRNVTDAARVEEERSRLEAHHAREIAILEGRLEQVEQFKLELTANVTHDLRTPLASIKACVSGLLSGDVAYDPQELRETLSVIEEETDRLQRRVQNLLAMSKMESGDAVVSRDWADITDVVASSLDSLRSIRGEREVRLELPAELPLVLADYDQVQIAVRNLVENAFLYSPADAPVEISANVGLGQLRVRVRDFGPGLMPDEFERVFDKFYRGRSARRIPGTGLGLPICRGIAEAHGGRLWAEHAPGGGVAFVLSLPVGGDQPELEGGPASATEEGAGAGG